MSAIRRFWVTKAREDHEAAVLGRLDRLIAAVDNLATMLEVVPAQVLEAEPDGRARNLDEATLATSTNVARIMTLLEAEPAGGDLITAITLGRNEMIRRLDRLVELSGDGGAGLGRDLRRILEFLEAHADADAFRTRARDTDDVLGDVRSVLEATRTKLGILVAASTSTAEEPPADYVPPLEEIRRLLAKLLDLAKAQDDRQASQDLET